ncbi:phytanoyl-CoA dioxygenase family protein [Novosphingobium flavum]|uniref:Phytanoyl-CoA dioxygenase family protein n=1 Tax=Novosphingobium flavum TaxID=1778672 RepID=A0A7X1KKD2_9SPHN|nr:phytanoyl-CoA dioxygenase family protein [Novosphingobium flavum]MBC2664421.1 phytanoyl-CoA dioxygenase family protein [Novosphingobium flavum]
MNLDAESFAKDGFVLLRRAVDPEACMAFGQMVAMEYERLHDAGWRFAGAGRLSGHLNIRMGQDGRALLDAFRAALLDSFVARIAGEPVRLMHAVGNFNLPGSCAQDFHIDGSFNRPILIANLCLVPTDQTNGATELVAGSHLQDLSYWRFARDGWRNKVVAPATSPGDVLIRLSNLWHRGTPNRSAAGRPMAAFSFVPERFLAPDDALADLDGPITLFANKYYGRWRAAKEILAARLPVLDEALRQTSSLIASRHRGRAAK